MLKKFGYAPMSLLMLLALVCVLKSGVVHAQVDESDSDSLSGTEDLGGAEPLESPPTVTGSEDDDDDDDDDVPEVPEGMVRENMVKWSAPTLSDEEAHSTRIPSNFKCDGCTAIAFQISTAMAIFHAKKYKKKGKMAPESEIIELIENICDRKTFENYGLKQMNGVNRLSGPGTESVDEPGMMQGGGKWPYRLHMMCGEIAGEMDEYDMYSSIVKDGPEELFGLICEDSENEILGSCVGPKSRDEL